MGRTVRLSPTASQSVDFNRLLQRLTAQACYFLQFYPADASSRVIDGVGKSAVDLAMDTIVLFLEGELLCTGDENAIFSCLRRVMEHDILDARGSSSAKTGKKVDTVSGNTAEDGTALTALDDFAASDDVGQLVEEELYKQRLYEALEHEDPALYDFVFAVLEYNALKPREIAEVLGTTPDDIQNRKKRLRTLISDRKLLQTIIKAA